MVREKITRRQKNISRLLRERKQIFKDTLKTHKKRTLWIACVCVALTFTPAFAAGGKVRLANDADGSSAAVTIAAQKSYNYDDILVVKVIDGDTLRLEDGEKVRLIGVDTPESKYNYKLKRDSKRTHQDYKTIIAMGKEATRFTKGLVERKRVKLVFDVQRRDRYERLLAYVYLPDGKMLNAELVAAGYAQVYTVPPNVKYADALLALQRQAREHNRGLWGFQQNQKTGG